MKKKGFTLIELLAVLVILAIIALITIPIVIRTINNSEENAEKQSILGYARAIEDDIANYMMINAGKKYTDYVLPDNLDYKGNEVECDKPIKPDVNGKLKLTCCKVVGGTGTGYDYENGKVEKSTDTSCNAKEDSGDNQQSSSTAVSQLLNKSNGVTATYESGSETSHQMYAFEHPATEQTPALTDYRYIGNDPYNYVEFNGETWRIIGVFTVEDENGNSSQRIKIIRQNITEKDLIWNESGTNDWKTASLNAYLNVEYYNELSSTAKEMISPAKTYLGGIRWNYENQLGGTEDMYNLERGTDRYDSNRSLSDVTNVTLLYPSDNYYTYAKGIDNICYNDGSKCLSYLGGNSEKGWIRNLYIYDHQWTVSSNPYESHVAFVINNSGGINAAWVGNGHKLRPVTYLKSTVKIASGTGTSSDPYKLKI